MKPAVSVIIPMYNAEKFIGECLESLARQTFQDFEIIIVDDCSTDNSIAVARSFTETFGTRLRIAKFSKNSGCPGIPRNFALEAAQGDYIYFLDSDDLVKKNALEELYIVAKNFDADVVHPEMFIAVLTKGDKVTTHLASIQKDEFVEVPTLETFDIGARITAFTQKRFLWWACSKLFRRKFLLDNKITFPALDTWEDYIFTLKCLVAAKNYVRVPFVSYCYRMRNDSISRNSPDAVGMLERMINVVDALNEFMDGQKFFRNNPQYRYALLDFFIQEHLGVIGENFFVTNKLSPAEVFEILREKKIFSASDHAALTAYLFTAFSKWKLEVSS